MAIDIEGLCPLIQVFDMPRSIAFYRDLLGFELVASSRPEPPYDWAWLRRNGAELMLNTAYESDYRPPIPDGARVASHADTILYIGCRDVDAAYAELRALGLDVKEPVTAHYGMRQLYLVDPDGYGLCFQWRVG